MCYLVAKNVDEVGCLVLQTNHGQHLADLKKRLIEKIGYNKIQLVTISRPSAYGEYAPYHFVDNEKDFERSVIELSNTSRQVHKI
jgi:hypothetical protein